MQIDDPHSDNQRDPREADIEGFIHAMFGVFSFYEDHDKSIYTSIKRRGEKFHAPVLSQPFRFLLQGLASGNNIELTDEEAYEQCRKIARLLQNPDNDYNLSEGAHKNYNIPVEGESKLFDMFRSLFFKG